MAYSTEANTIKGRKYRESRREHYREYQAEYKRLNYDTPTIRLAQVRRNLALCEKSLLKWKAEEAELVIAQAKVQAEKAAKAAESAHPLTQTFGQWMAAKRTEE